MKVSKKPPSITQFNPKFVHGLQKRRFTFIATSPKEGELAFSLENEPVKLGEILKYTLTIDNPGQTAHYVNVSVR